MRGVAELHAIIIDEDVYPFVTDSMYHDTVPPGAL
jgi:hypothetical protein